MLFAKRPLWSDPWDQVVLATELLDPNCPHLDEQCILSSRVKDENDDYFRVF